MIFEEPGSDRNALTEEKYSGLANCFTEKGFPVESVLYQNDVADRLLQELQSYDAILVWINPIEKNGQTRERLDELLKALSAKGVYLSAHPDVILKIGTKDVLYKTRTLEFGSDVKMYRTLDEFKETFFSGW